MNEYSEYGPPEVETLQMAGGGGASAEHVKQAAAQGLQGQATALPHLDKIQHAFGPAHDLSTIQAHVGGQAAQANNAMNAKAYASGNAVAFRDQPDLKLAAHEAAHVVQQRAGVSLSQGVGQSGDAYEKHADKVSDRVASGQSAADMLPAAGSGTGGVQQAVQRYVEMDGLGQSWRVSENMQLAVNQTGGGGQTVYAVPGLVDTANKQLETAGERGSFIRLEADGSPAAQIGDNKLHSVKPIYHDPYDPTDAQAGKLNPEMFAANQPGAADATGDSSDKFAMYSDCGRSSRSVMGWTSGAPKARIKVSGEVMDTWRAYNPGEWTDQTYYVGMREFLKDKANKPHLKGVHYEKGSGGSSGNPLLSGNKEDSIIMPKDGKHAKMQFGSLTEEGRKAFVQALGINEAANPEIGGAYTMATGYDLPGFHKLSDMTWNFHWAGVVMKDGPDNVTLENYAIMFEPTGDAQKDAENRKKAYNWVNKDWVFQMYGTQKEGQTFHEQHLASGTHGSHATSFQVKV